MKIYIRYYRYHRRSGSRITEYEQNLHFGEIYDLYAKPEDHWSFIGWSDNLSTNQTRSVIINNNEPKIAAKFSKTEYDLNTTVHTPQLGRIILSDSSLPFTSDKFTFDTTISLTAVPNEEKFLNIGKVLLLLILKVDLM